MLKESSIDFALLKGKQTFVQDLSSTYSICRRDDVTLGIFFFFSQKIMHTRVLLFESIYFLTMRDRAQETYSEEGRS